MKKSTSLDNYVLSRSCLLNFSSSPNVFSFAGRGEGWDTVKAYEPEWVYALSFSFKLEEGKKTSGEKGRERKKRGDGEQSQ